MCVRMDAKLLVIHVLDYPTALNSKAGQPLMELEKISEEHHTKLEQFCKDHLEGILIR